MAIKSLVQKHHCFFLGLCETKHKIIHDFKFKLWWGHEAFDWEDAPTSKGGGGVIACWDKSKFERKTPAKRKNGLKWRVEKPLL